MSRYTLHVTGEPLDDALQVLANTAGIKAHPASPARGGDPTAAAPALTVVVDAPNGTRAEELLRDALPELGSYAIARPEPADDEEDE